MAAFRKSLAVKWYLRALERHPTATMCLTTATLHAGGDVIAQKIIEKRENLELIRTGRFFLIGLAWDGPLLSWWYRALSRVFPRASASTTVLKVALDQGAFIPGMLASFLVLNAALKGLDKREIKEILTRDYFQLLLANYQLWPLAMALNFYLMPVKHQVLFTNSVSLAWNTYLSWKANKGLVNNEFAEKALANSELSKKVLVKAEQTVAGQSVGENGIKCSKCEAMPGRDQDGARDLDGQRCRDKDADVHNDNDVDTQRSRDKNEDARRSRDKDADATKGCLLQSAMRMYFGWNTDFLSHPYALLPR